MQLKTFTFSLNGLANTLLKNILLIVPNTSASVPNRDSFLSEVITMQNSMATL